MHMNRATSLTLLLPRLIQALEVTPNSGCSSLCDNDISNESDPGSDSVSYTIGIDVVCDDDMYDGPKSTVAGRNFKDCLTCELNSTATDSKTNQNEAYWVLFNMKFTFDWCVFAYPDNNIVTEANSQCSDVCSGPSESAKSALVDRLLQTNATIQYQYCDDGDGAFSKIADDCMKCLNKLPKAKTLANYVNALNVACDQQPRPGETLKLNFDLFPTVSTPSSSTSTASASTATSAGIVTVTDTPVYPPPSSSAALAAASSSRAAASASAAASAKTTHDNKVRVGVGVGVGVGGAALILAITAIILFRRRSTSNHEKFEGEARARWEAEYFAAHGAPYNHHHHNSNQPQQEQKDVVAELSAPNYLTEADDGRPLDPELPSPEPTSRSTSKTLRNSNYGMSRFMGRPAVPDKNMTQDFRR